jgi:hypothetical protein
MALRSRQLEDVLGVRGALSVACCVSAVSQEVDWGSRSLSPNDGIIADYYTVSSAGEAMYKRVTVVSGVNKERQEDRDRMPTPAQYEASAVVGEGVEDGRREKGVECGARASS